MKSAYQLEIEEKLRSLLEPVVADGGCELVELQFVRRKSSSLLRLLIDRLGGVTVDDCADISHRVSFVLETEDPIESRYTLEVSSPGLDRPLTTAADFRRKVGETVKVLVEEPETRYEVTGVIVAWRKIDWYCKLKAVTAVACSKML